MTSIFSLLDLGALHALGAAEVKKNLSRLVFVKHVLVLLPDVEMILSHGSSTGMSSSVTICSFSKTGPFNLVLYDLCHVMAEQAWPTA